MSDTTVEASDFNRPAAPVSGLPSTVFRRDPEDAARRIAWWIASVCAGFALYALVTLWFGQEFRLYAGWAFAMAAGIYVTAVIAAAVAIRPAEDDGLTLDGEGLTLTKAGRRDRFNWRDLGDFTVAARSGLARQLFGAEILIYRSAASSPLDAGPGAENTLRIGGGYLADSDEIAAALARVRDGDVGIRTPDPSNSRNSSAVFHPRDTNAPGRGTLGAVLAGVIGWICFFGGASAVNGVFDGWDAFLVFWTDPLSERFILTGATLSAFYYLGSSLWKLGPKADELRLDCRRLFLTVDGRRRRWCWDTVSALEIQNVPDSEGDTERRIVFIAHHDGISSDGATPSGLRPGAVRVAIDDRYDAPLDTIADLMTEFRDTMRPEAMVEGKSAEPVPNPT